MRLNSLRAPISMILCLCATASPPAHAAAQAAHPGGYGPIRLGMSEADAKNALAHIAPDAAFLSMAAMAEDDPAAMAKMVVAVPWEDTYVGTIDAPTRIQFGVSAGRVVTVSLRSKLGTQGMGCQTAFDALVKRNEAEFGPIQVADVPSNPAAFTDGAATFPGWTLALSRMEMEPGTCNLAADYTADADKTVEREWRANGR